MRVLGIVTITRQSEWPRYRPPADNLIDFGTDN
jgi:hypothetical protein